MNPDAKICPRVGHLVRPLPESPLAWDVAQLFPDSQPCGIIVNSRGIEVQVLFPLGVFSWVRRDQQGLRFSVNQSEPFRLPYLGEHNALNAIVAVLIGRKLGLHDQIIGRSLTVATTPPMRLQLIKLLPHHGIADRPLVVINDAYNANPESVLQALITLSNFPTPGQDGRRIAVLGDMFELGANAGAEHRHIGRALSQFESGPNCIHAVVLIGKLSACTAEELAPRWKDDRLRIFAEWDDSLPGKLAQFVGPGDVVLIKASRGMALERLIPALRATVEGA